ncbi:MAG: ribonuclease E/G [Actinomycetota bacterium]
MAAPARKRVLKKVAAKKGSESEASTDSKGSKPAKSAKAAASAKTSKKKSAPAVESGSAQESAPASSPSSSRAKKGVIPVPIFQAPTRKESTKEASKKTAASKSAPESASAANQSGDSGQSDEGRSRHRNRRRGGRGRGRNRNQDVNDPSSGDGEGSEENASTTDDGSVTHRRRRRRVAGSGEVEAQTLVEDGVVTTIKVREPKQRSERGDDSSSTRVDKRGRRRDRDRERDRDRDYPRSFHGNRRPAVITESEFLARRENVDRAMLVRQTGDRTQIAVLEDKILVEHYVNRASSTSYVGNVYLGRVQNVLPSMEAAFVDIGKGRNAVLYAGEVNWDAAGLADGTPRKIEFALKTGQPVLVQVTKDPIGQKGARLTSQISLPGRYLVYVPAGAMSGISRRLPDTERSRLKSILKILVPEEAGVIVRTAAEGATEEELTRDVARLQAQWEVIEQKAKDPSASAPSLLYAEPDLNIRVVRDIFNEDFNSLHVQGDDAWEEINNYLGFVAPDLVQKISKWHKPSDIFAEHRVEEQLAKALDRKVYLPSGGSLVIDRTEAMVVIDVNTGKFIGKGGNLEETVTKNNLEAAEEIARQLRLRDLGGIIVVDFIDMVLESNRDMVLRRLTECLGRDRTKHQVAEVTSLGLVQMTRKRVGQGLIEAFSTTCESCHGRGIHIHVDPVPMAAPTRQQDEEQDDTGEERDQEEEREQEEHPDLPIVDTPVQSPVSSGRRGRRRVSSGGVITPSV